MADENYSLLRPKGFLDQLSLKKRLNMLSIFLKEFPSHSFEKVLDVGVTIDQNALSSNFFEKYFPEKNKIMALSNQEGYFLEKVYPGISFKLGDAKALPFEDNSIDVVFSSAVIEHLGCLANQEKMIHESVRVAKKGVFITTPNRWHPMEVHTFLPLIHWLPKSWHRKILHKLKLHFYAEEKNLNLLDKKNLETICDKLSLPYKIMTIKTFGFPSNLILSIKKNNLSQA